MIDRAHREQVIADVSRLGVSGVTLDASYNGKAITPALRDELLAKLAANQHVELDLEMLAFEQKTGERNRKNIRIRDGALMAFGRSGKGKPFLRDHDQGSVLARGGTIIESETIKRGDGDYAVRQKARLTAPWAVDAALRGLLDSVSVGIWPTGPIECSACGTEIFDACWHCPGEELDAVGDNPARIVEWVYSAADNTETSAVNVPAVKTAHIESIRAALSAQQSDNPIPRTIMNPKLAAILCLAATASEHEVLSAVDKLKRDHDSKSAELGVVQAELDLVRKEHELLAADKRKNEEDVFIRAEIDRGSLHAGMEDVTRALFRVDPKKSRELAAKRADGSATPVGQPRQSAKDPEVGLKPAEGGGTGLAATVKAELGKHGVDADEAIKFARMFGAKNPIKTIAGELGLKEV